MQDYLLAELQTLGLFAIAGYLLGSIPFGYVLTRLGGSGDIRAVGSGNIGATNVLRTGRKDLAIATLLLDAGKGAVALLIARSLFPTNDVYVEQLAGCVAGGAAFLGHLFPFWLRFKGGKGVATFFGLMLAAWWPLGLMAAATWLVVAFGLRYSSLAALVAALLTPLYAYFFMPSQDLSGEPSLLLAIFTSVLIWLRHGENIGRLLKGIEPRIGAKKA